MGQNTTLNLHLLTSIKDEGPFLLEWIAHHKILGFDRIMVAYNDCTDGSEELLKALAAQGEIEIFENILQRQRSPQRQAYDKLVSSEFVNSADWLLVIDVDEFLCPLDPNETLKDILSEFDDIDVLTVFSETFGSSDFDFWEEGAITERFLQSQRDAVPLLRSVKCFLHRPVQFDVLNNHGYSRKVDKSEVLYANAIGERRLHSRLPFLRDGTRPKGRSAYSADFKTDKRLVFHHHSVKSYDSYCLRVARGRGVSHNRYSFRHDMAYFEQRAGVMPENLDMKPYFVARRAEEARLLSHPQIAQAQADCIERYKARIAEVHARWDRGELLPENFIVAP